MRHLKRFNESLQENYQEVTSSQFYSEEVDWDSIVNYSDKIVDYLKPKVDSLRSKIIKPTRGNNFPQTRIEALNTIDADNELVIAVDKDEWFWVEIDKWSPHRLTAHYKCDQLEGLFQLLQDKVIETHN